MYKPNIGGIIKCSDLDRGNIPKLLEELSEQIKAKPEMWVEAIRVIKYPSGYSWIPHGFTIEVSLMPKDTHKEDTR